MKTYLKYTGLLLFVLFTSNGEAANNNTDVDLESMRLISQAFARIKQNYIEDIGSHRLAESCVAGMASGLDQQSSFLGKDKFNELKSGNHILTGGLGLKLAIKKGYPVVVSPIDDTPATRAGIKSGDTILEINNNNTRGESLDNVVSLLRGEPGSIINLIIARKNTTQNIEFILTRERIRIHNVKGKLLINKIGYVRISTFINHTGSKLQKKLSQLEDEAGGSLNGLILDLRNNPGGLMSEAIAVADTFLGSGMIASTEMRQAESELKYMAKPKQFIQDVPVVILVNEGTAAASEIVSGALKDHQRATIIGMKTYGSGSIQTIIPLGNGSALKLTTARWVTPSGNFIHGKGIEPDVVVNESSAESDDAQLASAVRYINR